MRPVGETFTLGLYQRHFIERKLSTRLIPAIEGSHALSPICGNQPFTSDLNLFCQHLILP